MVFGVYAKHMKLVGKSGFTIIELIIVIVVIGILATIVAVSYANIPAASRDKERTSDIIQLKIAIEKYYADNSRYPVCADSSNPCQLDQLAVPLQPYLSVLPQDPTAPNAADAQNYRYVVGAASTSSYGLRVRYETSPICKTGANVSSGWWTSDPECTDV